MKEGLAVVLMIVAVLVLAFIDGLRARRRGEDRLSDEAVRNVTGRRKRDL